MYAQDVGDPPGLKQAVLYPQVNRATHSLEPGGRTQIGPAEVCSPPTTSRKRQLAIEVSNPRGW
jgi:hypothetical protein